MIEQLEKLLAGGQDNALLRFGLGNAYFGDGNMERAAEHLKAAVRHDRDYSAAWKLLGKALTALERPDAAADAYREGIRAAEVRGDKQAAKEMTVFLRRIEKTQ